MEGTQFSGSGSLVETRWVGQRSWKASLKTPISFWISDSRINWGGGLKGHPQGDADSGNVSDGHSLLRTWVGWEEKTEMGGVLRMGTQGGPVNGSWKGPRLHM